MKEFVLEIVKGFIPLLICVCIIIGVSYFIKKRKK